MSEPTSPLPEPSFVLETISISTTTPPSVLSQGMTDTQRKIMWKLLIELFLDRPKTTPSTSEKKERNGQ